MNVDRMVILLIRIHSYVMSFVVFTSDNIGPQHIQSTFTNDHIGPTHTIYLYK